MAKKGLRGYALTCKRVQQETIRLYENGDKDTALLTALRKHRLRLVEAFSSLDKGLAIEWQRLLYYKSKIPDILLTYSMQKEKAEEVQEVVATINEAIRSVVGATKKLEESEILREFFAKERERFATAASARAAAAEASAGNGGGESRIEEAKKEEGSGGNGKGESEESVEAEAGEPADLNVEAVVDASVGDEQKVGEVEV